MKNVLIASSFVLVSACGGNPDTNTAAATHSADTSKPADNAVTATTVTTATPAAAAPVVAAAPATDPAWPGMTGDDLDWAQKCSKGDGAYCTSTGNKYEFAKNDNEHALTAYKLGCDAKDMDPVSCMGLAHMTIDGKGTTKNVDEGVKIWAKGCDGQLGRDACWELAKALDAGTNGLKKDAKKAKEFYAKACDKNMDQACTKIGKKPAKK